MESAIEGLEAELAADRAKLKTEREASALLTGKVTQARARAEELERASLKLAAKLNELDEVSTRLAQRVVERDRQIRKLLTQLEQVELRRTTEPSPGPREPSTPRFGASGGAGAAPPEDVPDEDRGASMFDGLIEVEVGPLSDFAQLAGFEDAAGDIGGAQDISVKRFAEGRATLRMHLSEPVELLRELEERSPFEFKVRDTRSDRVILDLDSE